MGRAIMRPLRVRWYMFNGVCVLMIQRIECGGYIHPTLGWMYWRSDVTVLIH